MQGLDYLHTKCHIIHTDIKPENILLVNQRLDDEGFDSPHAYGKFFRALSNQLEVNLISFFAETPRAAPPTFPSTASTSFEESEESEASDKMATRRTVGQSDSRTRHRYRGSDVKVKIADLGNACYDVNTLF